MILAAKEGCCVCLEHLTALLLLLLCLCPCSAQLAEQAQSVPSINSLDFVMESLALGHTIMSHR